MIILLYFLIIIGFVLGFFTLLSFIMGESVFYIDNLILFTGSLFSHFIAENLILPYIWSPRRFYSTIIGVRKYPYEPPGMAVKLILLPVIIYLILHLITIISSQMHTLRMCNKKDMKTTSYEARTPAMMGMIGFILVLIIPFMKLPIIIIKDKIPFAENIMYGFIISLFTFIGYGTLKRNITDKVCK